MKIKKTLGLKILLVALLISVSIFATSCNSNEENDATTESIESTKANEITLQSVIEVFKNEGIEVDENEKPLFEMILAKDGVIFYIDGNVVKIYEYANEENYNAGVEILPAMKDWIKKGLIVLETSNDKAKEIFENIK